MSLSGIRRAGSFAKMSIGAKPNATCRRPAVPNATSRRRAPARKSFHHRGGPSAICPRHAASPTGTRLTDTANAPSRRPSGAWTRAATTSV